MRRIRAINKCFKFEGPEADTAPQANVFLGAAHTERTPALSNGLFGVFPARTNRILVTALTTQPARGPLQGREEPVRRRRRAVTAPAAPRHTASPSRRPHAARRAGRHSGRRAGRHSGMSAISVSRVEAQLSTRPGPPSTRPGMAGPARLSPLPVAAAAPRQRPSATGS